MQIVAALAFSAATVVATQAATDSAPARTRVQVGVPAGDTLLPPAEVELELQGQLVDTGLEGSVAATTDGELIDQIAWAEASVEPGVLAVFFVQRVDDQGRRLYLLEPETGELWVRELPHTADGDLMLGSLGAMVRGISVALVDGPPRGMRAVERPEPAPEPVDPVEPVEPAPAPVPAAPKPAFSITAAYAGSLLSGDIPWQSGGMLGLDVELASHGVLAARAGAYAPGTVDGPPAVDVLRIPIRLSGGYRFRADKALRPSIGAGLVLEPMLWWSDSSAVDVDTEDGQAVRVALAPEAALHWRVVRGFGFHVRGSADVWVSNVDLVVEDGITRRTQLRPVTVSAALEIGVQYTF